MTRESRINSVIRTMQASARSISRSRYFFSSDRTAAVCWDKSKARIISSAWIISTMAAGCPVIAAASAMASGQE